MRFYGLTPPTPMLMGASDVFLVKGLVVAAGKIAVVGVAKLLADDVAEVVVKDAAKTLGKPTTTVLSDVTVISKGKVVGQGDVYLRQTLEGIESGKITPRRVFRNDQGLLPSKPLGYYQEFVHPTAGVKGAGSQRIVRGGSGELYYTPDHYDSFVPLN